MRPYLSTLLAALPCPIRSKSAAGAQVALAAPYALAYALAPSVCHATMAGLEAATVSALSAALQDLDAGKLPGWGDAVAPAPARKYWRLPVRTLP